MSKTFKKNPNLFGTVTEITDTLYSTKIQIPQYLPKSDCPSLDSLYDENKYLELVKEIEKANITEEQKHFLLNAATRHIQFRYDKIADYYAHQSKEMQELMEHSALVIIDFEDAIANGYVKLSQTIERIRQLSGKEKYYDNM